MISLNLVALLLSPIVSILGADTWDIEVIDDTVQISGKYQKVETVHHNVLTGEINHQGTPVGTPVAASAPTIKRFTPEEMCAGYGTTNPSNPGFVTGPNSAFLTGPAAEFCQTWSPPDPAEPQVVEAPEPTRPSDALIVQLIEDHASSIIDPGTMTLAPNRTQILINKDVYLSSTAAPYTASINVLGVPVALYLRPILYQWELGDGTSFTTTTPGGAWPRGTAAASYRSPGVFTPSVEILWSVDIHIEDGPRMRMSESARTSSVARPVDVVEMESVLTRERK